MSDIKGLLNGAKNYAYDPDAFNPVRCAYVGELLKVLSDNSREIKWELNQIKKESYDVVDWKKEWMDYDLRIINLINWTQEGADALKIIDILDALDGMWKWDYVTIGNYIVTDENDEDLINLTKRFSKYAGPFISLYMRLATEYLRKNKKVPDYKTILKMCFCKQMKRYIETYLRNMKFSEEECKEGFSELQENLKENGFDLEASDNIQQSFIKLCREKYPLAKKNSDFIFSIKNFKNDFIGECIKRLDNELQTEFDGIIERFYDDIKKEGKLPDDHELMAFANIPINVISAMNEIVDDAIWVDWTIALYFLTVAEVFEKEHNKKLKKSASDKNKVEEKKGNIETGLIPEKQKRSWKNALTEKENDLIKQAVSYLDAKEKEWSIIKYITKLKLKDLPLKFHDLKTLFDIKEIPPQTEKILIDLLDFEYEVEEEVLKVKEEEKIEQEEKDIEAVQEENEIDDPVQYFIDKMGELWHIIDNESAIRKQLEEYLQNENYATVLKNLLKKPEFLKVFLHKWGHSAARVIRVWMTGRRFLFEKKRDDKIHLLYFANHNNYENRLAMIKNRRKW